MKLVLKMVGLLISCLMIFSIGIIRLIKVISRSKQRELRGFDFERSRRYNSCNRCKTRKTQFVKRHNK